VHPLGRPPLQTREQIRVQAQLNDKRRLRLSGELGVNDLIAVVAKGRARHANAFEEIGEPSPAAVSERTLARSSEPTSSVV
jgi:hypothetical protein